MGGLERMPCDLRLVWAASLVNRLPCLQINKDRSAAVGPHDPAATELREPLQDAEFDRSDLPEAVLKLAGCDGCPKIKLDPVIPASAPAILRKLFYGLAKSFRDRGVPRP